jgi:Zn-dependent peptidase ImmA (M78 family)/DNA-binding XRE family transcriptional regulator
MTNSSYNFFGERLKLARKRSGLSLQDLSDALDGRVTKQALNKYEQGLMNPTNEVLLILSQCLRVKPDYFMRSAPVELGEVSFRKRSDLSKKDEEAIIEEARDYAERFLETQSILSISNEFSNPLQHLVITTKEDAELAANELRKCWDLGKNPISNLTEMLELRGVKVLLIDTTDKFDGLAVVAKADTPLVVVNKRNKPLERLRFTIIHELAHILLRMHDSIAEDHKFIEELCHRFASAFLVPSEKLIELIGSTYRKYIKIDELIAIKEYYGISLRAILHRLNVLGVISETYYRKWSIFLSKQFGGKQEPGEYLAKEESMVMVSYVNHALAEEIISLSKAAYLLNTSITELRKGGGAAA